MARLFAHEVDRRLQVPQAEQAFYARALQASLSRAGVRLSAPQFVLLVDRSPHVQAAFIYWAEESDADFVGAIRASTGKPGAYDHFVTVTAIPVAML